MTKTVRYGVEIRTITGRIISTAEQETEADDPLGITEIRNMISADIARQASEAQELWDVGPAISTHGGVGGYVNTIVALAQIESIAVWAELVPKHAAAPVSPWEPGADDYTAALSDSSTNQAA